MTNIPPTLPAVPVIVEHLEDPPRSGLAACCGAPIGRPDARYRDVPRWLCTGCYRLTAPR